MEERAAKVFNGTFTIKNILTHKHRTFRIKTQKKDARFAPGSRIISVMTGPDNTHSYTSFGFVNDNGIRVWYNRCNDETLGYEKMVWELLTNEDSELHEKYTVEESLQCLICNRKLTTPDSLRIGIGPICNRGKDDDE